jgi:plastocyanin
VDAPPASPDPAEEVAVKRLLAVLVIATATVPALAVPAAQAGGGCHAGHHRDLRGVRVSLTDNCFDPLVVRVGVGQRVRWTNADSIVHTVSGASERWGSHNELGKGQSVAWRFDKAGVFPYYCDIHPGMIGAVVVGNGVSAETTTQEAGVAYVEEAPPPAAPPAAAAAAPASASGSSTDSGPVVASLLAVAGAVLIGAVVLLARRTSTAQPHPQL